MKRAEDVLHRVWSGRGPVSTLLLPLSWLYGCLSDAHLRRQSHGAWRAPVPVIVIGNILIGGTGKTPLAQALCAYLQHQGRRPGLISRGYGVRIGTRPHLSQDAQDSRWLGDEPALLHAATQVPVAVHPRRVLAAQALLAACPEVDVLVADDGLQHRALARDIEIIVQDERGIGNGRRLPAGPLRESPARLQQADWLVTHVSARPREGPAVRETARFGDPSAALASQAAAGRHVTMRLQATHVEHLGSGTVQPWAAWREQQAGRPVSAVAGIGQPARFFAMLQAQGLALHDTVALPDHGRLTAATLARLPAGPVLLTAKDAIKCRPPHDGRLWMVHAQAVFSPASWMADLFTQLARAPSGTD
ncbi:tetraacyldisaccharide 4'-kinase [Castellaniella sp.]|uniref:tetraacyldisaccharide 4'-kinase n=1 Tax=Castellaniella sp. TaxID=1955812 RepID=UPI00356B0B46